MPRMTQLSEAEVFGAIKDLVERGEYPTSARLRERLDHRGSPVVLQRFLAAWYERFGPEMARKAEQAPKKTKTIGLEEELRRLTGEAMSEFERAKAARVAELDERARELNTLQELLSTREDILLNRERDLDDREMSQAALVRGIQKASAEATQKKDEALASLAAAEVKIVAHASRIAELERAVEKTGALEIELSAVREELGRARGQIEELTRSREAAMLKASEESLARGKLAGALSARDEADAQRRAEMEDLRSRLSAATERAGALASQLAAANADLAAAAAAGDAAQEERAALAASLEAMRAELAGVEGKLEALRDVEAVLNRMDGQMAIRLERLLEEQAGRLIERIRPMLPKDKQKGS